nr:hypothetical protein Iba_chr11aCG14080 [Ipomoea batatas]
MLKVILFLNESFGVNSTGCLATVWSPSLCRW